ncbi:MAG: ABC transporter substrate-binding protein [Dehalococcoidia bacterium]|nr:ABC transporter substrate-binding protein [Dehalococcoidia bacterium]
MKIIVTILIMTVILLSSLASACAPAAPAPTPTATVAAAPTKAAEPTKPPAPAPTLAPVTLKFGSIGIASHAGAFMAIEKGFFKEQGINVEVVEFRTTSEMIAPLGTGQLDWGGLPLNAGLLSAADRGVELKVVADHGQASAGHDGAWMVLRKDLMDSGQVKTAADLKGMKVAVSSLGSLSEMSAEMMIEQAGGKLSDVDLVTLPFPEQTAAFSNKAIAASISSEPFTARGVQDGTLVKWIPISRIFGGKAQTSATVYGPMLLKNKELGQRLMVAYLKGMRAYLDAFDKNIGRDEAVGILAKYASIKDPKLYDIIELHNFDPDGLVDKRSMDMQYNWFLKRELYKGSRTFNDIIDLSFAEYAAQKLGKR